MTEKEVTMIAQSEQFILETAPKTNVMWYPQFVLTVCVLIEEWCRHNHSDAVEMAEEIAKAVKDVNATIGKY